MEVPGMVGAPSMGERLDASRNRPLCDRCTQPATVMVVPVRASLSNADLMVVGSMCLVSPEP